MAKRRDWRSYERDWRLYERFRRDEVELFLKKAKEVVWSLDAPWSPKNTGRPGYPARSMVLLCRYLSSLNAIRIQSKIGFSTMLSRRIAYPHD